MMRSRRLVGVALIAVCSIVAAACGDDDDGGTTATTAGGTATTTDGATTTEAEAAPEGEPGQVRLSYNPDPTIQWMKGKGMVEPFEEEYNVEFVETETFDPGPAFLGNRADIISVGTFEIAAIEQETGLKTVTFGRAGDNPYIIAVKPDNPAKTLADLQGKRIGSRQGGSGPLTVAIMAQGLHGLEYKAEGGEGGDFETVLVDDHLINIDLLLRGDVDAIATAYTIAAPWLRTGQMKALYDGKMTFEVMTEAIGEGKQIGFGQNNLVAREDWFDSHPNEVRFLLALYDEAAKLWNENKPEIIRQFPQEFNIETDEDAQYVIDILEERDFTPDTAYLDEDYVEGEKKILDLMADVGLLEAGAEQPRFEIVTPE